MNLIKHFLLGSIFFALSPSIIAQYSSVEGVVVSEMENPVSGAHIYISESDWAVSDETGSFKINSLAPGKYQIIVSRVGFKEQRLPVTLLKDSTLQLEVILEEKIYKDAPVVVTASRTQKELEDVSVPITVIDGDEISMSGNTRLSEVLTEQIGLNIISDHGTGIQVQGFDPEYTLIMIDNQPVIGRTAGTLDLTRLAVGNIEQIEIIKGPSSALWGSDALAGVINIITDKGSQPFSWDVNGRFSNYTTYDAASNITFKQNNLTGRFFTNINGSDGYDLNKTTIAPTVPEYQNYTFSGGIDYRANKNLTLKLGSRYYRENLAYKNEAEIDSIGVVLLSGDDYQEDYSFTPEIALTLGNLQLVELTGFISRFNSQSKENITETGENYYLSNFNQTLNKAEIKSSTFWNDEHTSVFGTGLNREDLVSENYADVPVFTSYFVYGQHEWQVLSNLSLTAGFRFDAHSEYKSQFSPKFSGLYKPNDLIHFRASLGGGFKAPAFNQLFLNFTNPTVGYSVFGTSTVEQGMRALQESGRVDSVLIPVSNITNISAENSFSYNIGFDVFPAKELVLKINFFRNNIQDMIDTQRIAFKTNGQSVFSYFNLNKVYTQGFESELRYAPNLVSGLDIALGYQFLDAKQEFLTPYDVVEGGQVVSKIRTEYGTLPNRSKHTGNLKLFYVFEDLGLETSFRATFRGRFGVDYNGNERIDSGEYVYKAENFTEAFNKTILNASIAKTFYDRFRLMVGVNNITNFRDAQFLPSNPGRTIFTQLNIKIH